MTASVTPPGSDNPGVPSRVCPPCREGDEAAEVARVRERHPVLARYVSDDADVRLAHRALGLFPFACETKGKKSGGSKRGERV